MTIGTRSRHRTSVRGIVFLDLGISPREAKRLLVDADAHIAETIRLK
jgi:fructose-bisphosphate aldolase class 1